MLFAQPGTATAGDVSIAAKHVMKLIPREKEIQIDMATKEKASSVAS